MAAGESQAGEPRRARGEDPERDRFIDAFGKAAADHGYRDLTIDQVARYAGTSRARIEAHFGSKEQGLVAAQDAFLDRIWVDVVETCDAAEEWPAKVRAAIRTVVFSLAEASALARVFAVEATAVSFAAAERQFAVLDSFATLLRDGRRLYPQTSDMPAATERALVGGVASIISRHLLAEEPQALAAAEPELVEIILVPYVGQPQARRIALG